jgi:hypothetical protein
MPRWWKPVWGWLFVTAVFFGWNWHRMSPSTRKVAATTTSLEKDKCGSVQWLRWKRIDGCHGIVLLELAGSEPAARKIVANIRAGCACPAAIKSVKLDYFLIFSYVALLGFFGAAVAGLKALDRFRWLRWLRRALLLVVFLQGVAGVLDGLEDVGLFAMLKGDYSWPKVAEGTFLVSTVKWWLILAGALAPVVGLVVAGLVAWLWPQKGASPAADAGPRTA